MKKILISGVSTGVGHALAKAYLDDGHEVYGFSRRTPEDLFSREHFIFNPINLVSTSKAGYVFKNWIHYVKKFDLVILNAGILSPIRDLAETPQDEIDTVMNVNVWANKMIIDALIENGTAVDQVVAISSGAAVSGSRGWNAYALSKATLNMLIMLYASEQPNTHFSAFAPGLIDTAMQDTICGREKDERYNTVERLKAARGTDAMPTPEAAAPALVEAFGKLRDYESGSFVDIRKM